MNIEKLIKEKRKHLQLTQIELAKKVGCEQKDISNWEKGKHTPNLKTIKKIFQALNINELKDFQFNIFEHVDNFENKEN